MSTAQLPQREKCWDAYIQQFRDLGMGQASMRWDADPGKVYKDVLRPALQRQVEKDFSCVATDKELIELKSTLGLSWHHLLCGPGAQTGRKRHVAYIVGPAVKAM